MSSLEPAATPPNSHGADTFKSALFDVGAHVRFWSVAVVALAADLWSKHWAFSTLGPSDVHQAIPSVLTFRRSINPGALFGMGSGLVSVFIVASFVALAFVLYMFMCSDRKHRSLHLALSFILAGSMGNLYDRAFIKVDKVTLKSTAANGSATRYGKIVENNRDSNYIRIGQGVDGGSRSERIARSDIKEISKAGVVRDFLKIEPRIAGRDIWPWVFNVADSLLVVGVGILMLNLWFGRGSPQPPVEATTPAREQT